jgi:RecJ-like exonuclease
MTLCNQCGGKGGTFSDTAPILDEFGNSNIQNQTLGVIACTQCNGKGFIAGMSFGS